MDHHVGEGNLFDAAPFPLHDHYIVEADGLGQGNLYACQNGADHLLGRKADDDTGHPG